MWQSLIHELKVVAMILLYFRALEKGCGYYFSNSLLLCAFALNILKSYQTAPNAAYHLVFIPQLSERFIYKSDEM